MSKKTFISIIFLFFVLLLSFTYYWFFIQNDKETNSSMNIQNPKNSIRVSNDITIVPSSSKEIKLETTGASKDIYIVNAKTNKKELIHTSSIPTIITSLKETDKIYRSGDKTLFVAYEFTELPDKNNKIERKNEHGHVFQIDKNGEVKKIYTTENIFDSAHKDANNLFIYEKIYLDDTNMYPSYYKPYISVKKVYKDGKFIEVERKIIDKTK
ncbi:hypothetical protein ACWKTZ_24130 [Bacillus cereus]